MTKQQSEEISDIFTHEGVEKLKKGQILIFDFEGKRNELKITKVNKKAHRVWAVPVVTYDPDTIHITHQNDELLEHVKATA